MDAAEWDERYAAADLVWSAAPNTFLAAEVDGMAPGAALDVACGEGRNAIWLAEQGWAATGVDFSSVAVDKARRLAAQRGVAARWFVADVVTEPLPPPETGTGYDLVAVLYLQLPAGERTQALTKARDALAPGGTIAIAEWLVNEDRRGPANGLIFAVNMLVNTDAGDTFSFAEIRAWLEQAGFRNARLLEIPGPSPLVLADRPTS